MRAIGCQGYVREEDAICMLGSLKFPGGCSTRIGTNKGISEIVKLAPQVIVIICPFSNINVHRIP